MSTKTTFLTVVTSDTKLSSELIEFFDKSERNGLIILNDSDPFQRIEEQETLIEGMRQRAEDAERRVQRYEIGVAGLITWLKGHGQAEAVEWVKENLQQPKQFKE